MFKSIVVGTDGSETAQQAVGQAAELARLHQATLHLVHAYRPEPAPAASAMVAASGGLMVDTTEVAAHLRNEAERVLSEALAVTSGVKVETHCRSGAAADAIVDVAEEIGADLIVVGNRGMTGARRFFLGSVPNRVAHHAPCSVMIIATT
jgi:nucleotide-binding universal stress UspA family protein